MAHVRTTWAGSWRSLANPNNGGTSGDWGPAFLMKKFSIAASELDEETLKGLLKFMPKRVLLRHAELHGITTDVKSVVGDLAKRRDTFTLLQFSLGFSFPRIK